MKKHQTIILLIFVAAFIFNNHVSLASGFRIKSLAQMSLILKDNENQLNLYDFGGNPAWLIMDGNKSWLRFSFLTNKNSGNFKRDYDPEAIIDLNGQVEGVKKLDKNQTFYGSVNYHNLRLNKVYQAINRNPYQQSPFRLTDSSTGSINYLGPSLSFQYSKNIYQQKLFIGGSVTYQIETGLKNVFPQPRTIFRYVRSGVGAAYRFSDQLNIGATFFYSNTQEFTEILSPDPFERRQVIVSKFRGENFYTESLGSLEQFSKNSAYKLGCQLTYTANDFLESGLAALYNFQSTNFMENRFRPKSDGIWKLNGYEINWRTRLKIPGLPIGLGLALDRIYFNDWAKHPDYPILMGDNYFCENRIGVGISYEPLFLPIILAAEYHFNFAEKDKNDYISRLRGSGEIDNSIFKMGAECRLLKNWKIRAGIIYSKNDVDPDLQSFSEFLPQNQKECLTFGIAHLFASIESEIFGFFGQQRPVEFKDNKRRDQVGIVFSMKIYRD
ncbi:hypothetical protein H8E88_26030 [candidate division KSB1 bacterium]|nr:hypothetical protein [candidate division KSB1 bacterium]